jgi:hypothetical protein
VIFGAEGLANPRVTRGLWITAGAWNLASIVDGKTIEAKPAALGHVLVPWFSTATDGARDFR